MIDISVDKYWNTKNILEEEAGTYSILFGYANEGPSLIPIYAKDNTFVSDTFGAGSILTNEYLEFVNNGGSNVWLVRINGSHFKYNIQGKFHITTLIGLKETDPFSYRIWDHEGIQFITIRLLSQEYSYNISDVSIKELCETINGEAILDNIGIYATYISNGYLENHNSEEEERIFTVNGANDYSLTEFMSSIEENVIDLIENFSPNIIGISEGHIGISSSSRYDFFNIINTTLNNKLNGLTDSIPVICVLPLIGNTEKAIEDSNNLIDYIKENPASINTHTENFVLGSGTKSVKTRYAPVEEYELFVIEEDGTVSEPAEGVCTFNENYGIIEILDDAALPLTLGIEYKVTGINLYKMLCVVYNNLYLNSELISSGVGALMGSIISSGLDGSIKTNVITTNYGVLPEEILIQDQALLKRNGIIYTKRINRGGTNILRYGNDKTFYSIIETDNPIIETANINLIRQIMVDFSKLLEYAFMQGRLIQIDAIASAIMEQYQEYVSRYEYRYGKEKIGIFQEGYYLELDLYINGILTRIKLGYSL